jgi:squalene-hopene/tetraprenyl-beta-curcumene cyclase
MTAVASQDTGAAGRGSAGQVSRPAGAAHAARAAEKAQRYLLGIQHEQGWWKGELETNITMDAEDLLLRQFLGIADERVTQPAARWIRSKQRADGTWATFYGGPGDLSTTIEGYVALKMAGDDPDAPHMAKAREFVLAGGGLGASRVFTRIWLALFGEWSWDEVPVMPPELMFLPSWFPLNVYDWGCWARQTVVALTVVTACRPVRELGFSVAELRTNSATPAAKTPRSPLSIGGLFQRLDQGLHLYQRLPAKPLRGTALRQATEWIVARQESDGGWGGIQPPWVYSIMALEVMGYRLEHPVLRSALAGIEGFTITEDTPDGKVRRLEACQSPVWDTALALTGVLDSGIDPDHEAVARAADWLAGEEIDVAGDWAVRRPNANPAGWAFEFANDNYPDTDDTAEIVLALRRTGRAEAPHVAGAVGRAVAWLEAMQSADGGWGAFDADNTRRLCEKLPFCDFGAVIDPPSADVTAHVVEMLAAEGKSGEDAARRGVRWLLEHQEPDGSWFGRWGANYVYGTGAAVPALVEAGVSPREDCIGGALAWLEYHQNADGGWGEDLRSYVDASFRGRGQSTPSHTAWALLALLAAGEESPAVEGGVAWMVANQTGEGTWAEDYYTGTGFPGDFYINYHLYRVIFPTWALGRYVRARS